MPAGGWNGNGQSYGWLTHQGVDYGTKAGSPIVAPFSGVTKFETGLVGYGNRLTLTLDNGWKFVFGHVAAGSNGRVAAGARIGITGANVGSAQGAVTLVEVHDPSGKAVNPHPILDPIFKGVATVTGLFGMAAGQMQASADQKASSGGSSGSSAPPGSPDFQAAWNTLIANLKAGPAEAQRNTAAQVGAIQNATNQITAGFKPVGDFFSSVGDLIQPKHLWTGLFVVVGGGMVVVGLLMYFKGGEIVQAAKNTAKEGAEAAAVAA